jgi:hypothetical protein
VAALRGAGARSGDSSVAPADGGTGGENWGRRLGEGFVPARKRERTSLPVPPETGETTEMGGGGRRAAADSEGLRRRREYFCAMGSSIIGGVVVLEAACGEDACTMMCREDSPWEPLRLRFMYSAMAPASLASTRLAIGDRAECVLGVTLREVLDYD